MTTIDVDYEQVHLIPQGWAYLRVWDWATLRHVVRPCIVSEMRAGVCTAPAEPDAFIEQARIEGGYRSLPSAKDMAEREQLIVRLLREHGPMPSARLAILIDCTTSQIGHTLARMREAGTVEMIAGEYAYQNSNRRACQVYRLVDKRGIDDV